MNFVYTMFTLYQKEFKNGIEICPVKGKQFKLQNYLKNLFDIVWAVIEHLMNFRMLKIYA